MHLFTLHLYKLHLQCPKAAVTVTLKCFVVYLANFSGETNQFQSFFFFSFFLNTLYRQCKVYKNVKKCSQLDVWDVWEPNDITIFGCAWVSAILSAKP